MKLFWDRRHWTVRKGNRMWIGYNYFYLNYTNNNLHYQKIKIPHLNSESLSELKKSGTEVSFKQFLNLPAPHPPPTPSFPPSSRLIEKTIYSGNLHHLPLRMLKLCLATVDNFNWQFSSSCNHSARHFL